MCDWWIRWRDNEHVDQHTLSHLPTHPPPKYTHSHTHIHMLSPQAIKRKIHKHIGPITTITITTTITLHALFWAQARELESLIKI